MVTQEVFPRGNSPLFRFGGSFGGWVYGAAAHGGSPDDNGNVGPEVNGYSNFAGVFGTGVYVNGVAGTSINNIGVYGQTGDDPDFVISRGASWPAFSARRANQSSYGRHWVVPEGEGVSGMAHETPAF